MSPQPKSAGKGPAKRQKKKKGKKKPPPKSSKKRKSVGHVDEEYDDDYVDAGDGSVADESSTGSKRKASEMEGPPAKRVCKIYYFNLSVLIKTHRERLKSQCQRFPSSSQQKSWRESQLC